MRIGDHAFKPLERQVVWNVIIRYEQIGLKLAGDRFDVGNIFYRADDLSLHPALHQKPDTGCGERLVISQNYGGGFYQIEALKNMLF